MNAPASLSDHSRALWKQLTSDFTLETSEAELLRLGLEALDRAEQARLILSMEGIISTGRYGQRLAHPAVAIERDSRLAAARLFRQLNLPEASGESASPLALRSRRAAS